MDESSKELTEFDSIICDSRLQLMKSAIPFVGPREQRFLSIYVKYVELLKTINLVKTAKPDSVNICSVNGSGRKEGSENKDFLSTIKKYCNSSERENLDMIVNLINTYKMFQTFKENSDGDASAFDILKSRLSPEQQEMFDIYSAMINT